MTEELKPKKETSPFTIGGEDFPIPTLTLWDLEYLRTRMDSIVVGLDWIVYAKTMLNIAALLYCDLDEGKAKAQVDVWSKACSIPEMRELGRQYNELLSRSGFVMTGEAQAAPETGNPGTGTSTESPPTLQSEGSVEGTQSKSNVH